MAIEDIPEVNLEHQGIYKFVQIKGPEGQVYLAGSSQRSLHRQIVADFLADAHARGVDPLLFRPVGGGFIHFLNGSRRVHVSGESQDYGCYEKDAVQATLENYLQAQPGMDDYRISVDEPRAKPF